MIRTPLIDPAAGVGDPSARPAPPAAAHPGEEAIPVLLSHVTRLFWRRLEMALKAADLDFTAGEARTLVYTAQSDGLRQCALAERLRIEPMTLVGFLDRLESRGLVERSPDPADRRAKLIRITPAAARVAERILAASATVKAEVTAGLDGQDVERLRQLLLRIRGNLDALAEAGDACTAVPAGAVPPGATPAATANREASDA